MFFLDSFMERLPVWREMHLIAYLASSKAVLLVVKFPINQPISPS
jgi:hypothetical protein